MRPLFMRKMFGPAPIPKKFDGFPKDMALWPSQIRASAVNLALMVPDAFATQKDYGDLKMPVVIIAGEDDRLIDIEKQFAVFTGTSFRIRCTVFQTSVTWCIKTSRWR